MLKTLEPVQELHHPWKVQTQGDHVNWEQNQYNMYTGKYRGGICGPSNQM